MKAAGKGGLGRLSLEAYQLLPDSPCLGAVTDYTPDLGTLDYWGKALHELKKLSIGAQQ